MEAEPFAFDARLVDVWIWIAARLVRTQPHNGIAAKDERLDLPASGDTRAELKADVIQEQYTQRFTAQHFFTKLHVRLGW